MAHAQNYSMLVTEDMNLQFVFNEALDIHAEIWWTFFTEYHKTLKLLPGELFPILWDDDHIIMLYLWSHSIESSIFGLSCKAGPGSQIMKPAMLTGQIL